MRPRLVAITTLTLLAVGCDGSDPIRPGFDAGRGVDGGGQMGGPTYYGNIRPILVANCTNCHTTGGIAPFALETFEQVTEVGFRVRDATRDRIMPPFLADASGACNDWGNDRTLEQSDIDMIGDWVAGGMQEGDPSTPMPEAVPPPTLPSVDYSVQMPDEYFVDADLDDDYRCFLADPGLTEDLFVTGYDVHPGNAQRVHHVIVYNPLNDAAVQEVRNKEMAEGSPTDGYTCFGGSGTDQALPVVLWAPGGGATTFPRGTGIQLTAGRPLIIQVHYNNLVMGAPPSDRTTIDLATTDTASPAVFAPLLDPDLNIPPRMALHEESRRLPIRLVLQQLGLSGISNFRAWGVLPHMHTLGDSLDIQIEQTAANQCMIDLPRWDFNWQLAYWLRQPLRIYDTDTAIISCRYNSMERDTMTHWGDGTQDEMCIAFVYVTL